MDEVGHRADASRVRARVGPHRDGARRGHPRPRVLGARGDGGAPGADRGRQPARERDRHAARAASARCALPTRRTRGEPRGVLHGLPIAVKDLEDTAGMRTTYGSPLFADARAGGRLAAGRAAAAAGAIVIGKTNTPEFGAGLADVQRGLRRHAQPVGPLAHAGRVERRRGGGGGRGDAAVRRRLGSRRQRPQPGRVLRPRRIAPLSRPDPGCRAGRPWNPLPVHGPIARTVADARCCFGRWRGPDPRDPLSLGRAVRRRPRRSTCAGCGSRGVATWAGCRSSRR